MIYKIGSLDEAKEMSCILDSNVINDICLNISRLEYYYGEAFDYSLIGGVSVVIDNMDDLDTFKSILNFELHPCEWSQLIEDGNYISALFVLNNDYSVMLYLPKDIAPASILDVLVN